MLQQCPIHENLGAYETDDPLSNRCQEHVEIHHCSHLQQTLTQKKIQSHVGCAETHE